MSSNLPSPVAPGAPAAAVSGGRKLAGRLLIAVSALLPFALSRALPTTNFGWSLALSGAVLGAGVGLPLRLPGRWLAIFLALVAGLVTSLAACGLVLLDNPTPKPLTYRIDGTLSVPVPAGDHEEKYLPFGTHRFEVLDEGRVVDSFDGHVDAHGKHLATPFGTTCYGIWEHIYGALSGAKTHGDESLRGKRFYTLHYVDYYFKDPPSSVSVGSFETGRAERSLGRSRCQ